MVYGEPDEIPTPETAPKLPLSPYGVSKLTGEYYLDYYLRVRGLEYVALRYLAFYRPFSRILTDSKSNRRPSADAGCQGREDAVGRSVLPSV